MLLRRISQHLKEQNWFAVVLDFFIVVGGIFVGLQVNSWNDQRNERLEEYGYLVRLSEDAAESLILGQEMLDFQISLAERGGTVMKTLETCSIEPGAESDVANGFYHMGKVFPPYMIRGTIDELNSTGKIGIIRNLEIRKTLVSSTREYNRYSLIFEDARARILDAVAYIYSVVVIDIEEPTLGDSDISWDDLNFDLETACQDRALYAAVAATRNWTYDISAWHQNTITMIERLKETVDSEIANYHQ